ncbi:MAG: DUF3137 domain-containing protein [Xenococcaceae cyanobacterium]
MLEQFNYLQSAKDFIDRGEYGKAIELLESYEQLVVNANYKGFLQIKISLIDAYAGDGQIDRAISLSEKLANNSNLEIKTWAEEKLKLLTKSGDESLEDNTSDRESSDNSNFKSDRQESATENETTETPLKQLLNREEAEKFLKEGNQFFRQKNYPEAIENLEKFCQGTKTNHPNRFNALRNLVKAYQQNQQLEKAIALCTLMSSESQETIKIWGQQFLNTLASATAIETSSTTSNSDSHTNRVAIEQTKPSKIKLKTLAEFKEYCRNNLVGDLKYFETKRKQSLRAIIVASSIFLAVAALTVTGITIICLEWKQAWVAKRNFQVAITDIKVSCQNYYNTIGCEKTKYEVLRKQLNSKRYLDNNPYCSILLILLIILVGVVNFSAAFYSSCHDIYSNDFKIKIIEKILAFVDDYKQFKYSIYCPPDERIKTLAAFKHSGLFFEKVNDTQIFENDVISGQIGTTQIYWSEICIVNERYNNTISFLSEAFYNQKILNTASLILFIVAILHLTFGFAYVVKRMIKGEKLDIKRFREEIILQKVTRHNIFKGLFFRADFNKTFLGVTWIVPNDVYTKVKFLSSSQEVKLEDSEFNRLFKVYSTSQVEARYILSTNLISKIVDFSKRINKKVYISFVKGKIYIAIKYDRDLFEPRLYQNMLSIAPIKEYFESIQLMLSIAQELNLNRKIWAKE